MSQALQQAVFDYVARGWVPIPVHGPRERCRNPGKQPVGRNWQRRGAPANGSVARDYGAGRNVGLLLGEPSGHLVDLDLDCLEAVTLAPALLPPTGMKHGRRARGASHWWYRCDQSPKTLRLRDEDGQTLVEVRGTGGQTVVPPSVHPSGEQLVWVEDGKPARVRYDELVRAAGRLAAASVLVRRGWSADEATAWVRTPQPRQAVPPHVLEWVGAARRTESRKQNPDAANDWSRAVWEAADVGRVLGILGLETVSGRRGRCPLRDHEHARDSFTWGDADPWTWFCHACDVGGNTIHLVAEVRGISYARARAWLSEQLGVPDPSPPRSRPTTPSGSPPEDEGTGPVESSASAEAKKRKKKRQADELIDLAAELGVDLFHDDELIAWASLQDGETHGVRSRAFKAFLSAAFYERHGKAPGSQAQQDALGVLEGRALHEGPLRPTFVRVAHHDGTIYLDLANATREVVAIATDGWRLVRNPPVRFRRPKGLRPLPVPARGGRLEELRDLVNVGDPENWALLKGWLVCTLSEGPYFVLALQGEQGCGKSFLSAVLLDLLDPRKAALRSTPREVRDLAIAARNGWVVAFDNLSGLPGWLSDALCRLATGGGFATRALYEDNSEALFEARRPMLLNGIDALLARPDLADRALVLHLPTIPDTERRPEVELKAAFANARPRLLGALLDAVACALRRLGDVNSDRWPRMADAARWVTAAEPALGLGEGDFLAALETNRTEAVCQGLEADPLAAVVLDFVRDHGQWRGTPTQLYELLGRRASDGGRKPLGWPGSAARLSDRLRRLAPSLRTLGVDVRRSRDGGKRSLILDRSTE
ncbi:MAG: hypothetical protein D6731_18750 [Planctomycetota bacterium]|nr:MAG: hypothetical protein D6731_18750 [Planctomycetota bacterium]